MASSLRRAADDVGAPLGLVLEGGYDLGALSRSMAALMPVVVADGSPEPVSVDVHPLATSALERLQPYWPGLTA